MILKNAVTKKQMDEIERLYLAAFPPEERKPFSLILEKREEGVMEILAIEGDDGAFCGLAITILYKDLVLLDYFAVSPELRGGGVGGAAFNMLIKRYSDHRLLLEIESTRCETADTDKARRKAFYTRHSMEAMDFLVELFGVEMEILTYNCTVSFDEYHEIFRNIFSEKAADKVRLI